MNLVVLSEQNLDGQFASRTHVLEFCHSMAKLADVTFLSYTPSQIVLDTLNGEPGFDILEEKQVVFPIHNLGYLFSTIKVFFRLQKMVRSKPIDLLYIRAIPFGLGPLWFARRNRIPAILEINGVWDEEQKLSFSHLPPWKRWGVQSISRIRNKTMDHACNLADLLIAVTPNISKYLQSKGIQGEKICIATNGVNTDHFRPLDRGESRKSLGLPVDTFMVGYVGSLSAWQGVDDLIEASALFQEVHPRSLKTMIIGDGPQRQRLEKLSAEKVLTETVLFLGAKPYAEIPCYMCACDVLVAPKKPLSSGYSPLKVYEYLACGRPVLVSAVNGLEYIPEHGLGFSFDPGNIPNLANQLTNLYSMPSQERDRMGQKGRVFVIENHSWDSVANLIWNTARQYFGMT